MKTNLTYLLFLVLIFGCTKPKEETTPANDAPTVAEYALDLDSAVQYIHRYDSLAKASLKGSVPIKAFTIRAADMLQALGLPESSKVKYTHARVYLGTDANGNFRLFFTPVDGASISKGEAGKDVILTGPHKHGLADAPGVLTTSGSYVLDFTAPCPNTCPTNSPLNPANQ
jgi:hypothetical protein